LGALTLSLTLLAWRGWPEADPPLPPLAGHAPATWSLRRLYLLYGLNAAGLVPHMVFLVDFVARGLDRGLETGSAYWVVFGMGATLGPVLAGAMGDRLGFTRALPLALLLQAGAIALPLLSTGTVSLVVSSLVVGTFVPGIVPLVLGRMQDFVPPDPATRRKAWSLATAAFAVGQAAAAYGLSYAFAQGAGYEPIFAWGAGALVAALGVEVAGRLIGAPRSARGA
ncbi:MAG: YbfB/YjiJ family MFS transporter, partial [Alphaproteobacteria bacterium]|nr:YbfB/YjiJ family MFS transporter [Alphaproteobacteria bacterium]